MEFIIKLLTVLGLAAVELWVAIPTGLMLKLDPLLTGITAAVGAMLSVIAVVLLGERVQAWLVQRHGRKNKDRQHGRIYSIWSHLGVVGLGLLAPLLVGPPLGTALAIMLGAPTGRLLFWMGIGIVLWSAGLTLAGALGLVSIEALMH